MVIDLPFEGGKVEGGWKYIRRESRAPKMSRISTFPLPIQVTEIVVVRNSPGLPLVTDVVLLGVV